MSKFIQLFVLLLLVASCKKEEVVTPKVRYENTSKSEPKNEVVATDLVIADLPIHFADTSTLLFPVGNVVPSQRGSQSFTISNNSDFQITGYLKNMHFQDIKSDSIIPLTDQSILIETATYLKSIADKHKKKMMVYTLADADTNKDQKIDENDIQSLYISQLTGKNFTKISADFNELIDWKVIDANARLYYKTIEDTDKNGQLDQNDQVQYYYVDLLKEDWKSIAYFPLKK